MNKTFNIQKYNSLFTRLFEYIGSYSNALIISYIGYSILYKDTTLHKISTSKTRDLAYFVWILVFNLMVNIILKNIIKEPRPSDKSRYGIGYEYGMPSGHSQFSTFLLLMLISIDAPTYIKYTSLILTIVTYTHRYVYKYHTPKQILGGVIVGGVLWKLLHI